MRRWVYRLPHATFGRALHTTRAGMGEVRGLPPPRVLVIEERSEGFFIKRFTESGTFSGDTWHETFDDATHQATFEYDVPTARWVVVPDEIIDPISFALTRAD